MTSSDQFINEPIEPTGIGAPQHSLVVAPEAFTWRDQRYQIVEVLEMQKGMGHDRTHGSRERYLDKQWFRCRLDHGGIATIYFERRARGGQHRWWLYGLEKLE